MGGEELKWHQLAHHQLMSQPSLVHTVQLKPMIKAHISGRMVSSQISDALFTSVHSEKTHLKKLIMNIFYVFALVCIHLYLNDNKGIVASIIT